jgi:hypothetical protein
MGDRRTPLMIKNRYYSYIKKGDRFATISNELMKLDSDYIADLPTKFEKAKEV